MKIQNNTTIESIIDIGKDKNVIRVFIVFNIDKVDSRFPLDKINLFKEGSLSIEIESVDSSDFSIYLAEYIDVYTKIKPSDWFTLYNEEI